MSENRFENQSHLRGPVRTLVVAIFALALAFAGCAAEAGDSSGSAYAPNGEGGSGGGGGDGYPYPDVSGGGGGSAADVGQPPPTPEAEEEFRPPSAGDRYVFVLHPAREQAIVIDGLTLEIELVTVGLRPTVLATAPGKDVAVVVNAGGDDLSVLHAHAEGTTVTNVPSGAGVNRLAVAPDGRHAVAFFSFEGLHPGAPIGSLQSVTVVRTVEGEVASVEVGTGFHPVSVSFAADGRSAFVVTEEGVTRIPLEGPLPELGVLPTIPITDDPLEAALEREVIVTPAGDRAVVRTLGQSALAIVDLASGAITRFTLPGEPTDVDLTPDGAQVLVMMRRERTAVVGVLDDVLANAAAFRVIDLGDVPMGAAVVAPTGGTALLYTTVDDVEGLLRLDLETDSVQPVLLQKTVRGVAYGPTGARALVLHRTSGVAANPALPLDAFVDASEGYSVIDVSAALARLELVDHAPGSFAFTPSGLRLYVLLPDPGGATHAVADIDLLTLMGRQRPLASPPETVQPVPGAGKVAVSQDHPTGRITFLDVATGESDTLTGFELGGLID